MRIEETEKQQIQEFGHKMKPRLRIISYFSLPTDLAAKMRNWPEFIGGEGNNVDLQHGEEFVAIRFIEDEEADHIAIFSSKTGSLLDRVAGCVVYALAAHSDYLMVDRFPNDATAQPDPARMNDSPSV